MIVLVVGSHGTTGQLLIMLLAQGGHAVRAMVREWVTLLPPHGPR
jgi:hypothetical protein